MLNYPANEDSALSQLSAASLLTLIQLVDREMGRLLKAVRDNPGRDYLAEMQAYEAVAVELAEAYRSATRGLTNFPVYSDLISTRE
jgi:hypothetical protein